MSGEGAGPPDTLRWITRIEITGKLKAFVTEVPLEHGQFDGTPYSTGTGVLGDQAFHWVVTEGAAGAQMGARVMPEDKPTSGQFYKGVMRGRTKRDAPAEPNMT